ncbi:MAG: 30S ribosomal protein S19 [Candidatus Sungbacteria bacterium]|nr:30S ribosomal protein S19 [Candidatus Sungbacteria bacterium]
MSRSLKKGPYVHPSILKHMGRTSPNSKVVIKIWSRASVITPEMIGYAFGVHNGKNFIEIKVMEDMVGHHFGEFSPTRKFVRHGGKMQKEIEQKKNTAAPAAAAPAAKTPGKK